MKNNLKFILRIILIAFALFFVKHLVQAIIEWTNIIPVHPKAYIWGEIERAQYVFAWQFIYTYWIYVLGVIVFYYLLKRPIFKNIANFKILVFLFLAIFLFLLYKHNWQFPYKEHYFPSVTRLNFELLEELIIFSIVGYLLVLLVDNYLINNNCD